MAMGSFLSPDIFLKTEMKQVGERIDSYLTEE
jgi:hypothetical protein